MLRRCFLTNRIPGFRSLRQPLGRAGAGEAEDVRQEDPYRGRRPARVRGEEEANVRRLVTSSERVPRRSRRSKSTTSVG